jgi:membrane fusion protein (multidrug efflux system)
MRGYVVAIAVLLVIFGSIGGYLYQRFSAFADMDFSPPPVTIAASTARQEVWRDSLNAVGTIQSKRGVELTTESSGEITRILFESGDQVRAGQLLVVLNDEVERASRENQAAALELARILFERDQALIERGSIPQSQLDRSRADFERARAQLAETEARLDNKRMEAPFAGTIGISRVDVGDYVSPGTVIATLQDHTELEIDFTVPARHAPQLAPGLEVSVQVDAFPGRKRKSGKRRNP